MRARFEHECGPHCRANLDSLRLHSLPARSLESNGEGIVLLLGINVQNVGCQILLKRIDAGLRCTTGFIEQPESQPSVHSLRVQILTIWVVLKHVSSCPLGVLEALMSSNNIQYISPPLRFDS